MLNFNRRDRIGEPAEPAKTALKPAIYEPPAAGAQAAPAKAPAPHAAEPASPRTTQAAVPASAPAAKAHDADAPESRLFVGVHIKLKGVEICDCDSVVIEGHVEATVRSTALEIARPGTLNGTADIDVAEIHGEFVGELTARTRLVVHGTGRVSGTIRYGKLVVAEGGELTGDVKRLEGAEDRAAAPPVAVATAAAATTGGGARQPLSPSSERWSN
jgi:cytoskeletal protein CcmA (bactofilin family)